MRYAITRTVSPSLGDCELTFLARSPIDIGKASGQHEVYRQALARLGVQVINLPAEPDLPDAVFVEDTAIVLDELAVITRPGALSRRAEIESVAAAISQFRPLQFIEEPATIEGGDVMRVGRTLYVGLTARTNGDAVRRLRTIVEAYGYRVEPIEVTGCLHLKSACTHLGRRTILANRNWIDARPLAGFTLIDVPEDEPWAANTLTVAGVTLIPTAFPRTRRRLAEHGFNADTIEISELQKAEAGLTCLSLRFDVAAVFPDKTI